MSNRILTRQELADEIVAKGVKQRHENPGSLPDREFRLLCYMMMRFTGDIRAELDVALEKAGIA